MPALGDDVLIRARGLGLRRDGRSLLADIDLELRRGEHWLIWGPSGAGKTLLARLLAGFDSPAAGSLELPGDPPLPLLFQDPDSQLAAATVRDEVALGALAPGERRGCAEAIRRVGQALRDFRLAAMADRNPHSLSGGEKRRLGLAALSVLDAELLILDEPDLHLDEPSWREASATLDGWRSAEPRLLIEISRDPSRALSADGLIILRDGRLVAAGPPREIYLKHRAPDLPRVASFEDEPPPRFGVPIPEPGESILSVLDLGLDLPDGGTLLAGLNLEVRRGERILITGENGSGKSTLLLLLAGLAEADRGDWRRKADLKTALALQDPERCFFAETVEDEIAFAPSREGISGEALARRVEASMSALGIGEEMRRRDPITLSAGEKRRVALASLLATEPDLLFLDEAGAGLDPVALAGLIEALCRRDGGFVWADCRIPPGLEDKVHRRYTLSGGKLTEVAS